MANIPPLLAEIEEKATHSCAFGFLSTQAWEEVEYWMSWWSSGVQKVGYYVSRAGYAAKEGAKVVILETTICALGVLRRRRL
ncbi:hypothetical protein [Ammonifex thiophilus]|uniref:hypothetical protein n=1 Tax=Ammonifex thiophilus TaxID=444093 RepID=UPI00106A7D58|nr:hypothetical protein [Ammonifex thiophilus]